MFSLSKKQFDQLSAQAEVKFGSDAFQHVCQFYPDRVEKLGNDRTKELLDHALRDARAQRFTQQSDVLQYVNLIFEFGPSFPSHQRFAWAAGILTDETPGRLDRLYAAALALET